MVVSYENTPTMHKRIAWLMLGMHGQLKIRSNYLLNNKNLISLQGKLELVCDQYDKVFGEQASNTTAHITNYYDIIKHEY